MDSSERIPLRKHLNADALNRTLYARFEKVSDGRRDPNISIADALMAGYAVFSLKYPSLLKFDENRQDVNMLSVFGIENVPCDSQLRDILDPVNPDEIRPGFADIFRQLQRGGAHQQFRFLDRYYLVSVDGSQFFRSEKIHCERCLVKNHRNGAVSYSHQMLAAVMVHPDHREVIPLCMEPIVCQDGNTKNDCERNAAKRLLPRMRREHSRLPIVVVEDGLGSNGPHILDLKANGFSFILGVKPGDHEALQAEVFRRHDADRVVTLSRINPKTGGQQEATIVRDVPLNATHPDLLVHYVEFMEFEPANGEAALRFSWVTDLDVTAKNVWEVIRGGRSRWKVENETFNTLKNQGYHAEHNYGHGAKHLAEVFSMLMMLAFLVDQVQQLCCPLFQAAWRKRKSKSSLWEKLRGTFDNFLLQSMQQLLETIAYGVERAAPAIAYPSGRPSAPHVNNSS